MDLKNKTALLHNKIKENSPLIHNITNFVVMNSTANILLASGASPVMAHSIDEVEEMTSISNALVLNIGTLDKNWIDSMIKAGKKANKIGIPVILDPVGSGATTLRTESVKKIINEVRVSVIRGNASEIFSIESINVKTKGVDSSIDSISEELIESAMSLSRKTGSILAISGKKDLITNGKEIIAVENGHPVLTKITGIGCGLSAVIAAFCSVEENDLLSATSCGFAYYGVAAELTAEATILPGTFNVKFIDSLFEITKKNILDNAVIYNL